VAHANEVDEVTPSNPGRLSHRVTKQEEHLLSDLVSVIQENPGDASIAAQIDQTANELSRLPGDGWSSQRAKG
jgi:hypothetical protein